MAKGNTPKKNQKLTPMQRQARTYQVLFSIIAIIVLVSLVLSLLKY